MASSYTAFDPSKPVGTDSGIQVPRTANANDVALWYSVIMGAAIGWRLAVTVGTGTVEQPQYWTWVNDPYRVRSTNTWGTVGGAYANLTQQVWEVSQDGGSTYVAVCTQTWAYDANGNLSSAANAGSFMDVVRQLFGKLKTLYNTVVGHIAGTGTAVHGLGTMAIQQSSSVWVTGGTIDNVGIGSTTPRTAVFTQARSVHNTVAFGTTTYIDWSAGESFDFTASGSGVATLAFSNLPSVGRFASVTVEIINGGLRSWTYPSGTRFASGVAPTLSASGRDRLVFMTRDGGLWYDCLVTKDLR